MPVRLHWFFGMKLHIGVDAHTGLANSAVVPERSTTGSQLACRRLASMGVFFRTRATSGPDAPGEPGQDGLNRAHFYCRDFAGCKSQFGIRLFQRSSARLSLSQYLRKFACSVRMW